MKKKGYRREREYGSKIQRTELKYKKKKKKRKEKKRTMLRQVTGLIGGVAISTFSKPLTILFGFVLLAIQVR